MFATLSPRDGAVVTRAQGTETQDAIEITVEGRAEPRAPITVNGIAARRDGPRFSAQVRLQNQFNEIRAVCGTQEHVVRVVWDKSSFKRYRFFIDDNIFFLDDIAQKGYGSLFECFYLERLRKIHRTYGTKFALNIFYKNDHGDFDLSRFPDRYRSEWKDNAHWLSLSFHSYSEFPDRPYQDAPPEKLAEDFDLVKKHIVRFAGEETWSPPTVIHWAMLPPVCLRVLTDRGVRVLNGAFRRVRTAPGQASPAGNAETDIGYGLDAERGDYLAERRLLHDFEHGVTYMRGDVCCNAIPKEEILQKLEARCLDPRTGDVAGIASHEQYSFPFYANYIPDHFERMETAVRYLTEQGYAPVFTHEGFVGNPTVAPWRKTSP